MMAEVAPGLHRIDRPLGERINTLWLVAGSESVVLFDTGTAGTIPDHVVPYLSAHDIPAESVRWVVASHCDVDHFGGIGDVAASLPEAQVVAHRLDAPGMTTFDGYEKHRGRSFVEYGWDEDPAVIDWCRSVVRTGPIHTLLDEDITLDLGDRLVEVQHLPGHSAGHLGLYVPDISTALISDAVLGRFVPFADGRPAFPPTYRFVSDYLASIDRLATLSPSRMGTAHYGEYTGSGVQDFLDESRTFVYQLEGAILAALSPGEQTDLPDLLAAVNPMGDWPQEGALGALAYPVIGHLENLQARGLIRLHHEPTSPFTSAELS